MIHSTHQQLKTNFKGIIKQRHLIAHPSKNSFSIVLAMGSEIHSQRMKQNGEFIDSITKAEIICIQNLTLNTGKTIQNRNHGFFRQNWKK